MKESGYTSAVGLEGRVRQAPDTLADQDSGCAVTGKVAVRNITSAGAYVRDWELDENKNLCCRFVQGLVNTFQ